ncbi:DUF4232 domain-containing protein [Streptomyces sp. HPF1205]|uniref:DUF4232 domain-containing protein n=1 Tax=Streptomyces sp. HPF1205 TaxID=2873262 RepID=UPI001CEC83C2|nr:DUF4232 domain-containing protein [Streptomyces sp. HPF1205]
MTSISRRALVLASAALFAATGATVGATGAQAADGAQGAKASPPVPNCQVSDLHLSIGRVTAGAGSVFVPIQFQNVNPHNCVMRGYPVVVLLDQGKRPITFPARRSFNRPVTTVTVRTGHKAFATIRTNNQGFGPRCRPPSSFIRVFPPGAGGNSALITYRLRVCGMFRVSPVSLTAP